MSKSHYDIFGISPTASQVEIKAAYRKLALQFHPDRNSDKYASDVKMKEINFIYSILSNPEKRKWYDSTISFSSETANEEEYNYSKPYVYCNEITVTDSKGKSSTIKVGNIIFYLVEIDKSIITWKYKTKEYFDVVVKKIFDPAKKDLFASAVKFDFNKTPLFLVHWGNSEMIIYKEDFENLWLSHSSYKKIDNQKGIITGVVIFIIIGFAAFHFATKYNLDPEKREEIINIIENNKKIVEEETTYFKEEYFATESDVSYILSEYYYPCIKNETIIKYRTVVFNIPDKIGISKGEIAKGEVVIILLYCPKLYKFKIKYNDIIGWVSKSSLENPVCDENEEYE